METGLRVQAAQVFSQLYMLKCCLCKHKEDKRSKLVLNSAVPEQLCDSFRELHQFNQLKVIQNSSMVFMDHGTDGN